MVIRNRIKMGVEIECLYNADAGVFFERGSHTTGKKCSDSWSVMSDGSIWGSHKFDNEEPAEFVSKILGSKKTLVKALEEFRALFNGKPLSEVLDFNKSCGCHFHIGLNNNKKFHDKLNYKVFMDLRKMFFKEIENSDKLSEDTKKAIIRQYHRKDSGTNYAREVNKAKWESGYKTKYVEFNLVSEDSGTGLEWRSLNLCDVKTWREFNAVFEIIYKCIEWLFKMRTKNHKEKFKAIRFNKKDFERANKNKDNLTLNISPKNAGLQNINLDLQNNEVLQCVI